MITAIDTNVLAALWDTDPELSAAALEALDAAQAKGQLLVCAAVYAELLAWPGRSESMLDEFFASTAIRVEWGPGERVWRVAGKAFAGYVRRRSVNRVELPRRILADFLIGAHAIVHHCRLMTLDQRLYGASFPELEIIAF